ncbi:hypothetical protein N7457_000946 [Penicillium paradoxum]|uniref:uncharacterized protein n=1 Tax=Penicillium paradoxum TaxID=176176 RepID=UPI0025496E12|nr:uncharacterized protein N7457_000946 [Penicillium paradoxum]KAJ5794347.1 hypothetical protein N7457_000946 [Penicillium paradoxum]
MTPILQWLTSFRRRDNDQLYLHAPFPPSSQSRSSTMVKKPNTVTAAVQKIQVRGKAGSDQNDGNKPCVSFHPHHITPATFRELLSRYSSTVEQAHSHKIKLKLQSKSKSAKGSKRKAETKDSAASTAKTDLDPSEDKHIREETNKYLQLDQWRYETLPKIIAERKDSESRDNEKGAYLLREELIDIMEWKLKHGVSRPMLMGMIKNNQDTTVINSTSTAFAALPNADPVLAPNDAFPKTSLDALTGPLRGVGPATASLILSISTVIGDAERQVPFYSDDVYLWLCLMDFPGLGDPELKASTGDSREGFREQKGSQYKKPNGDLIAKYNMNEYRDLWNAVQELRARLNKDIGESGDGPISLIDIERVAYVLRNITFSGYYTGQYPGLAVEPVKSVNSPPKVPENNVRKLGTRSSKRLKQ